MFWTIFWLIGVSSGNSGVTAISNEWSVVEEGEKIDVTAIEIETNSADGSGHHIWLHVFKGFYSCSLDHGFLGIEFSDPPKYVVWQCTGESNVFDQLFSNLPDAQKKVWRISISTSALVIHCNDVEVARSTYADSPYSLCKRWSETSTIEVGLGSTAALRWRLPSGSGDEEEVKCVNGHEDCFSWAANGYCESSAYVRRMCVLSCSDCAAIVKTQDDNDKQNDGQYKTESENDQDVSDTKKDSKKDIEEQVVDQSPAETESENDQNVSDVEKDSKKDIKEQVEDQTPSETKSVDTQDLSDFEQKMLTLHNELRAKHVDTGSLRWSEECTRHARDWANGQAAMGLDRSYESMFPQYEHSDSSVHGFGESIYWTSESDHMIAVDKGINKWYNEIEGWNFNTNNNGGKITNHFTQLVWKSTTELGCAFAQGGWYKKQKDRNSDKYHSTWIVCAYNPTGNIGGTDDFGDNVMPLK